MGKYDVVVLGSINLDVIVDVNKYPQYGNTVFANNIKMLPGGKGSNQAVAVAKQGKNLLFLGAVGDDSAGKQMLDNLKDNGVDTEYIQVTNESGTGTFVAFVDQNGENTMAGSLGANAILDEKYVVNSLEDIEAKVLLLQMETSKESILAAMKTAKEKGMFVILDPAPADGFFMEALEYADLITPNQQEKERLTGIKVINQDTAINAAEVIAGLGVKNSIIKMGSNGNLVYQSGKIDFIPSLKVKAVNTVGAGDTFAGALASAYIETQDLAEAVKYGNVAAGIKVSREGGQDAIPTYNEVTSYLESIK